ncbi:iron chelate uptake ABC transporter family permease subunit [Pontibacterium granulatum]|uniref:iron chelate uptake ABC transporter family permease subunit n=1 Tax=Pontibacterium granulatum TaxID=2036029 RepID=UPI00249CAF09|nr:iron chelate uptake ABC transporter family permease subunit [Pontibacterium granulatum]MDI3324538.1 iron chelate uptake ABC transporter family permease subunit [Pontibacterium granulatum]
MALRMGIIAGALLLLAIAGVMLGTLDLKQAMTSTWVLQELRLSRVLIAILAGAALGIAGALTQGVIRNPLASPDLIGVTAGSGLAATTTLLLFPQLAYGWLIPAAIIGGLLALLLLLWLTGDHALSPSRLVLVGIALSFWFGALVDWLLSSQPQQINAALVWLTGSLWGRGWSHVWLLLPCFLVLIPFALTLSRKLDLLALGDDTAHCLGTEVRQVRLLALSTAVALAAISVAVCGAISFIGLVAPHLARLLVGGRHLLLVPTAALLGAALLLCADIAARTLAPPIELPAGVLTSVIGAPYFMFLMLRYRGW